jgi:hypothetical protein
MIFPVRRNNNFKEKKEAQNVKLGASFLYNSDFKNHILLSLLLVKI